MAAKTPRTDHKKTRADSGGVASSMIGDVEQFMQLMIDNDLTELNVEDGQRKILLKRGPATPPAAQEAADGAAVPVVSPAGAEERQGVEQEADQFIEIKSPMVGTFYGSSSPDVDDFVAIGDVVGPDHSVCIIEAMKVMNEIKAECAGAIVEICVKNAQPVEFGQPLFKVKPT